MDAHGPDDPDRDATALDAALNHLIANARPFARDTRLSPEIMAQYTVGRLLRERAFCDASCRIAGLVAPHRFLIVSAEAAVLDETGGPRRGLCVLQNDAYLKVIDHTTAGDRAQVTLLHVPEALLGLFRAPDLNPLEDRFIELARACFADCLGRKPVPELDTDDWRRRLEFPLGFDDDGRPWPLSEDDEDADEPPPFAVGDTVTCDDGVRHGDIVLFDRVAADRVVIRVCGTDDVDRDGRPRFRAVRGDKPGTFAFEPLD